MIYCIWYPSGGFGHFVNAVISLHGENFVRPLNTLTFSSSGNSHSLKSAAPKYYKNKKYYFNFLPDVNYSVLVDNGIVDEGTQFLETFPSANIIKLCYTDYSWPVIAYTCTAKAMKLPIEQIFRNSNYLKSLKIPVRQKYFLFLRDQQIRYSWKYNKEFTNINIETLLNYKNFKSAIEASGIKISPFEDLWREWHQNNFKYFNPMLVAQDIIKQIKNKESVDLTSITNDWTQAVVYYYIWLEFCVDVTLSDYSNWFTNTKEVAIMLNNHGVIV